MARQQKRREKDPKIKLKQPDRSGPSQETLLDIAEKRGLFKAVEEKEKEKHKAEESADQTEDDSVIGRFGEAFLWSLSLTMLHFTLDVLVTHQYAVEVSWPGIISRAVQAFPVILLLFYSFHPHASPSVLLPRLPPRIQPFLHQLFFFVLSVSAGCYLIYISNTYGYYAVMKRSPALGCIWVWSVIELNLFCATTSLICCGAFLKYGDYSFL
ncbi:hypothetical protein M430DRAFT_36138 [Amorphotheca resinae ATCC 22711]|uniref:DUF7719 domain-containing protein n=1 Tax=Amorphotheca resinae ATCC 22711 TaxID=857342 RepID=A0A2T3AW86_AMORE|nr:hypothetical protein M430DRAFT_36138 [Amorphotheca resinae ATCC 22711]PSS12919.1 hypothetical protein M430DRAFT_36138 [Amorphotheca resinae ATCC 22711]